MEGFNTNNTVSGLTEQRGSLLLAILAGLGAAVISCALWTLITVWTNTQFSIVAIAVGLFVGAAVKWLAKGTAPMYGVIAAILALMACVCGDFCCTVSFLGKEEGMGFWETLSCVDFSYFFELAFVGFDFYTVLFYGIAVYEAYIIAINKEEEVVE